MTPSPALAGPWSTSRDRSPTSHPNVVLIRTGATVPGIALPAKLLTISAVNVNPVSGSNAVLGTLSGVAASSNQALWTGSTQQINDPQRLPTLRLRKGDLSSTRNTPLSTIKGLTLKPATDASGAGGRGLGQVVGLSGHVLLSILGDRSLSELVVMNP